MRLTALGPDGLNDAQRAAVAEAIAGVRGRIPGPMRAWIHSPTLASRAQLLGAFLRYGTTLSPALSEFAILLTARHMTCSYVWNSHVPEARKAGLDQAIIDAVAKGDDPVLTDPASRTLHDYATTLLATHRVPQALHEAAIAAFGETGVVELVGILGYYSLVALTVNAFAFELPEGATAAFGDPSYPVKDPA